MTYSAYRHLRCDGCGPAHAIVAVLRNGRCSPWSHDWTKTPISGGWGRPRELWRCTKCPVVKAKGD